MRRWLFRLLCVQFLRSLWRAGLPSPAGCALRRSFCVRLAAACAAGLLGFAAQAAQPATIRVGVLQFGTVNWELEAMQRGGFAEREGLRIEVVPLALKDAANVALLGSAVDVIVNDWIWVARQRAEGRDFTFVPYSLAVGGLLVRPDAGIQSFADLRGKRLGIAGGPLDKSWLLLRAHARRVVGEDAAQWLQPDFVAPPLLNELMLRGELPAGLNFWHYAARLRAAGMQPLLEMDDILATLDVHGELPLVGWVFRESWAQEAPQRIESFLRASAATKRELMASDAAWLALRPMMKAEDDATFFALRDGFRAGIPSAQLQAGWTAGDAADGADGAEAAAAQVFHILAQEGGRALVGEARALAPGTFWRGSGRP